MEIRSWLQSAGQPTSNPADFFHQLTTESPILLPSLEEAGSGQEARRDWDTEMTKTSLIPVFLGEERAMTVCPPQEADPSSSFASGSIETKLQRDHFSIPCPPDTQWATSHSMSLGKVSTIAHSLEQPSQCSPGVMLGVRNQPAGVSQAAKGSTKPQLELKRAILLPSR